MQLDLDRLADLGRNGKMVGIRSKHHIATVALSTVSSQLNGVPPMRFFEAGKTHIGDIMLFRGQKTFERLGQSSQGYVHHAL